MRQNESPACDPDAKIKAEASAWLARLHGPGRTAEVEAGLRRWLQAASAHQHAFDAVTDLWGQLPGLRRSPLPQVACRSHPARLRRLGYALAAALGVVLSGLGLYRLLGNPTYTTGAGEERQIVLSDGSRVWLNANTRLEVGFRPSIRKVTLREGEAYFEVSHNPKRPFVVLAGRSAVTALGTIFDVRYLSGQTSVTLVDGRVRVTTAPPGGAVAGPDVSAQVLMPGQRLRIGRNRPVTLDAPALLQVTAWRFGEILFDDTSLADAVDELNRDSSLRIVLDSTDIGRHRVSGIYHMGDSLEFARAVASLYDLDVTERGSELHLHAKR